MITSARSRFETRISAPKYTGKNHRKRAWCLCLRRVYTALRFEPESAVTTPSPMKTVPDTQRWTRR